MLKLKRLGEVAAPKRAVAPVHLIGALDETEFEEYGEMDDIAELIHTGGRKHETKVQPTQTPTQSKASSEVNTTQSRDPSLTQKETTSTTAANTTNSLAEIFDTEEDDTIIPNKRPTVTPAETNDVEEEEESETDEDQVSQTNGEEGETAADAGEGKGEEAPTGESQEIVIAETEQSEEDLIAARVIDEEVEVEGDDDGDAEDEGADARQPIDMDEDSDRDSDYTTGEGAGSKVPGEKKPKKIPEISTAMKDIIARLRERGAQICNLEVSEPEEEEEEPMPVSLSVETLGEEVALMEDVDDDEFASDEEEAIEQQQIEDLTSDLSQAHAEGATPRKKHKHRKSKKHRRHREEGAEVVDVDVDMTVEEVGAVDAQAPVLPSSGTIVSASGDQGTATQMLAEAVEDEAFEDLPAVGPASSTTKSSSNSSVTPPSPSRVASLPSATVPTGTAMQDMSLHLATQDLMDFEEDVPAPQGQRKTLFPDDSPESVQTERSASASPLPEPSQPSVESMGEALPAPVEEEEDDDADMEEVIPEWLKAKLKPKVVAPPLAATTKVPIVEETSNEEAIMQNSTISADDTAVLQEVAVQPPATLKQGESSPNKRKSLASESNVDDEPASKRVALEPASPSARENHVRPASQ